MTIEAWAALAQVGTFVVIAVTAIAALIQLRHLRASNQLTAIQTFAEAYEGNEYRDAFNFVRTALAERLEDPHFRRDLRLAVLDRSVHPEVIVCNFFDQWGGYYRLSVINRQAFMRHNAGVILWFWQQLQPAIALISTSTGGINTSFEHFEYLAVQADKWMKAHPNGDFPKGESRMALIDPWHDADEVQA